MRHKCHRNQYINSHGCKSDNELHIAGRFSSSNVHVTYWQIASEVIL